MQGIQVGRPVRAPGRELAAFLAIAAGLIHLGVTPRHLAETFESGLFMLIVGLAQIAAGLLLLVRPSGGVVVATTVGTVVVLLLFAIAYSVGLPFGPKPGEAERLGPLVIGSKLAELGLLLVLSYFTLGGLQPSDRVAGTARRS